MYNVLYFKGRRYSDAFTNCGTGVYTDAFTNRGGGWVHLDFDWAWRVAHGTKLTGLCEIFDRIHPVA